MDPVTAQFLADLRALLGQVEAVVAPLPTIDVADRRSFRLQANVDEGFKVRLQALIAQRAGSSSLAIQASAVESLDAAAEALQQEANRLESLLTRVQDAATLAKRDLVLLLRVAKSAFSLVSGRSGADLKEQLTQVGSRFSGRRKRKPRAAPVPGGTPAPTVAVEMNRG